MVTQSIVAKTLGWTFLVIGVIGFFWDPILGLFDTNLLHNFVHLGSGAVLLWAGYAGEMSSKNANLALGGIYAAVTLLGLLNVAFLVDLLDINFADDILHLLLTGILLGAGLAIEVEDPHPMTA